MQIPALITLPLRSLLFLENGQALLQFSDSTTLRHDKLLVKFSRSPTRETLHTSTGAQRKESSLSCGGGGPVIISKIKIKIKHFKS